MNGDGDNTDGGAESETGYGNHDAFFSVFITSYAAAEEEEESTSSGGGAAARLARARILKMIANGDIPKHYDTEAPALSSIGIFTPVLLSAAPKEEQDVEEPEEAEEVEEAEDGYHVQEKEDATECSQKTTLSEAMQRLQQRTCRRVERYLSNEKMLSRINRRLEKRFGFACMAVEPVCE